MVFVVFCFFKKYPRAKENKKQTDLTGLTLGVLGVLCSSSRRGIARSPHSVSQRHGLLHQAHHTPRCTKADFGLI